jgi:hypothetical protein
MPDVVASKGNRRRVDSIHLEAWLLCVHVPCPYYINVMEKAESIELKLQPYPSPREYTDS